MNGKDFYHKKGGPQSWGWKLGTVLCSDDTEKTHLTKGESPHKT